MKGKLFNLATKSRNFSGCFNEAQMSEKIAAFFAVSKSFNCSLHKEFKGDISL
ncbi:hypothetical protein [Cytobacillus oceanisediminis]|uniref:hypothetical protein n=1 Tax=Cytobacillus oceanisediminis TaxID=665099 RepID=UPI00164346A9|nr:hypothetical protein [Cytobacillus oceanisediminis]